MMTQAILAFVHYVTFSILVACLVTEWMLLEKTMPASNAWRIKRADLAFGVSAGVMAASGIVRLYHEKGPDYYTHNPIFWIKISLFVIIGLISITPTLHYLRWKPQVNAAFEIDERDYNRIRFCLWAQLLLLPFIPLCAVLMARGFGV